MLIQTPKDFDGKPNSLRNNNGIFLNLQAVSIGERERCKHGRVHASEGGKSTSIPDGGAYGPTIQVEKTA